MKAIVLESGLQVVHDRPIPTPAADEALIRVHTAGICATDLELVRGYKNFRGVLGHEFVGTVAECSDSDWIGERVCADINVGCENCSMCRAGLPTHCTNREVIGILSRDGVFASHVAIPTRNLHRVPDEVSADAAVFTEPLAAACRILQQVPVTPGQQIVVLGDGRLGNLCAQVLHAAGADVLVLGKHESKLELLRRVGIGAQTIQDADSVQASLTIEATGSRTGLRAAITFTRPLGTIVMKSTFAERSDADLSLAVVKEITILGSRCGPFDRALTALANHEIDVLPLISARYPLEDGLAAFRRASAKGILKVLLDIDLG